MLLGRSHHLLRKRGLAGAPIAAVDDALDELVLCVAVVVRRRLLLLLVLEEPDLDRAGGGLRLVDLLALRGRSTALQVNDILVLLPSTDVRLRLLLKHIYGNCVLLHLNRGTVWCSGSVAIDLELLLDQLLDHLVLHLGGDLLTIAAQLVRRIYHGSHEFIVRGGVRRRGVRCSAT